MKIKNLEVVGFKSFKDPILIEFGKGITSIVGPNGCGKSNIVDALLWVMGEMSAKHLRGNSMEEMIFNGTEKHPPAGFTQVSITLEQEPNSPFPALYAKHAEITLTRRLNRNGESEYLVNQQSARLKDIHEIFMDTGAGTKGFSIIEQGQVARIVNAKPEDRRFLIEEVAGITKFQVRKRFSQRKLLTTQQNLSQLDNLLAELEKQIRSLKRQASQAEKYRECQKEMENIDLEILSRQFLKEQKELQEYQSSLEQQQDLEQHIKSQSNLLESQLEKERLNQHLQGEKLEQAQQTFLQNKDKIQSTELSIQELQLKIQQEEERQQEQKNLLEEYQANSSQVKESLRQCECYLKKLESSLADLNPQIQIYEQKKETKTRLLKEIQKERENLQSLLMDCSQKLSAQKASQESLEEKIQERKFKVPRNRNPIKAWSKKRKNSKNNDSKWNENSPKNNNPNSS